MLHYFLLFFKLAGALLALYVITTTIVFFLARIRKDAEGNYILDPESWHFRLSYPIKCEDGEFYGERISICRYFAKFSWMLYVGWPFFLLLEFFRTLLLFLPFFLFGRLIVPSMKNLRAGVRGNYFNFPNYKDVKMGKIGIPPAVWILPMLYLLLLYRYTSATLHLTLWILGLILLAAVIPAAVAGIGWFLDTDNKSVSLAREWMATKKRGICPLAKISVAEK